MAKHMRRDQEDEALKWLEMELKLCGVDEAGRGPIFGVVTAAACVLDPARPIDGLNDSKKLTEPRREALAAQIKEQALGWAIAHASVEEIDRLNILQASMLAMQRAVAALPFAPDRVLVDGNKVPDLPMPSAAIVQGDARVPAISAASILAKVERDRVMRECAKEHDRWEISANLGYPTPRHLELLRLHGPSPLHRKSFAPVRDILQPPPRQGSLWDDQ